MSRARPGHDDSLLLIAATAILVLAAQRYFQGGAQPGSRQIGPADTQPGSPARELAQHGRGRYSSNPLQIPWAGWKDILWRTYESTNDDRLLATAAGVVFFGLLAVFPAVTALVSSYGLFADASTIGANLQTLALMLPEGSFQIVQDQIARVLAKGNASLGATFLFGLALALWSANAGVKAIIDALERRQRGAREAQFPQTEPDLARLHDRRHRRAAVDGFSAVVAFPLALDHLGIAPDSKLIVSLARWPLLFVILLVALGMLYRFGPSRRPARWQWLSVGTRGRGAALDRRFLRAVLVSVEFRRTTTPPMARWAPPSA